MFSKDRWLFVVVVAALSLSCAGAGPTVVPWRPPDAATEPLVTLVWVGRGETERLDEGGWRRAPEFDYEFSVEQRRFATHWESVKHLTRRHPGYDGSAGPREQTLYFRCDYSAGTGGEVVSTITSSLGRGHGGTDREFRTATMSLRADVSRFAPFNTYRIAQTYGYEGGVLDEEVALVKVDDHDQATPWVRNTEHATLFAPRRFDRAPSTFP